MRTVQSTIAALLLVVTGCSGRDTAIGDLATRKLRLVATTGMIADVVRVIGGERVEVTALMGPGVDPHTYKPTPTAAEHMQSADLLFYNGLHLEGQMGEILARQGNRGRAVAEVLPASDLRPAPEGFDGLHDPHVWFDVSLWNKVAAGVRDSLVEIDPTHAEVYARNAKHYLTELDQLHDYVKAQAGRVPPRQRVLITAHDAFYYFGRAYGFEVRGLQGVSTDAEASAADREELARFIAERRIAALFVESSVPTKSLQALQESVKSKGFEVAIGGQLYSDALGVASGPAGTYIGMVRHNIDTIVAALTK